MCLLLNNQKYFFLIGVDFFRSTWNVYDSNVCWNNIKIFISIENRSLVIRFKVGINIKRPHYIIYVLYNYIIIVNEQIIYSYTFF